MTDGEAVERNAKENAKENAMGKDDWFRSREWTEAARGEFEARLARSRRKAYHLVFKAGALSQSSDPSARSSGIGLLERVIRDHAVDARETAEAHQLLAQHHAASSDWAAAVEHYRACLAIHARVETGHAYAGSDPALELAELLVTAERLEDDRDAEALLRQLEDERVLFLPEDLFRHAVASARVAARARRARAAASYADAALEYAKTSGVELDVSTRAELEGLARRPS